MEKIRMSAYCESHSNPYPLGGFESSHAKGRGEIEAGVLGDDDGEGESGIEQGEERSN